MRTAAWTESISVLDRVTAVFDAFAEVDEGLGVSELARRANLPKSTVSRIASDLVAQRLLDRDGGKLYLGLRLFELAQTVEQPRMLRRLALPVMSKLRDTLGHTVSCALLEGADVVVIAIARGALDTTQPGGIGSRLPAHATALGKAILALSPRDVIDLIIERGLKRRTSRTVTEPTALLRELGDVRRLGVATEHGEFANDRVSAASAILGPGGAPIAAIAVSGSAAAVVPDRLAPAVRAAASRVSRRIGAGAGH